MQRADDLVQAHLLHSLDLEGICDCTHKTCVPHLVVFKELNLGTSDMRVLSWYFSYKSRPIWRIKHCYAEAQGGAEDMAAAQQPGLAISTPSALEETTKMDPVQHSADGANPVSKATMGIIFEEQTEITSVTTAPINQCSRAIPDDTWTIKDFVKEPVRVFSGQWNSTSLPGQKLLSFNCPSGMGSIAKIKGIMDRFRYFRCRWRFRVELNGTPFHTGKLVAYWSPVSAQMYQTTMPLTDARSCIDSLNHAKIFPAYNTVVEIEIPWIAQHDYQYTAFPYDFATFNLAVYNQLRPPTGGSQVLNYSVYLQIVDAEFKIPTPSFIPSVGFSGDMAVFRGDVAEAQGIFGDTNVITNVNNFGNMDKLTVPNEVHGDSFQANIGLDCPTDGTNPMPMRRSTLNYMSHSRGIKPIHRMCHDPRSINVCDAYNFESTEDEMDILAIARKKTLLRTVQLSTTNVLGDILFQCPITPFFDLAYQGVGTGFVPGVGVNPFWFFPPAITYMAMFFNSWRGGISFCIESLATQFHTTKLFAGILYGVDTPIPSYSPGNIDPSTVYGKVFEVNKDRQCFEIDVDYDFFAPWCNLTTNQAPNTSYYVHGKGIGTFFISVLNPLVAPNNVSTVIDLNILVGAGKDFQLAHYIDRAVTVGKVAAAQGMSDDRASEGQLKPGRARRQTRTCAIANPYNDNIRSFSDILKRTVSLGRVQLALQTGFAYALVGIDDLLRSQTTLTKVLSMYLARFGDIRIKLVADYNNTTAENAIRVQHIPYMIPASARTTPNTFRSEGWLQMQALINGFNDIGTFSTESQHPDLAAGVLSMTPLGYTQPTYNCLATVAPGVRTDQNYSPSLASDVLTQVAPSVELEIPYGSQFRFSYTTATTLDNFPNGGAITDEPYGYLLLTQAMQNSGSTTTPASVQIFFSAGDSFRTGIFCGIPPVAICAMNMTSGPVTGSVGAHGWQIGW